MIPISDENPSRHPPLVSWIIIAACIATFIWQASLSDPEHDAAVLSFAFIPARLFVEDPELPAMLTLVTSMFLHGGLLHLGGNMLYLWVFGNNVEEAMGHIRFFVFYVLSGMGAALTQAWFDPASEIPMVGASGAISGVLAGYVLIYPRARITVIVPLGILLYPVKISALFVVGFWFLVQLFQASITGPGEPGVAWWAHLGGFGAGFLLTPFFSRFPLYGRWRRGPWG
jgi:membrane associated rhomboid family serine protease